MRSGSENITFTYILRDEIRSRMRGYKTKRIIEFTIFPDTGQIQLGNYVL